MKAGAGQPGARRALPAYPALAAHLDATPLNDACVILRSESEARSLDNAVYAELITHLDGRTAIDEIVRRLAPQIPPEHVYLAIHTLQVEGCIVEAGRSVAMANSERAFWNSFGVTSTEASEKLAATTVSLAWLGEPPAPELEASLRANGIMVADRGSLLVVVVDDYLHADVAALDRRERAERRPWLLVRPRGREAWLGPLFCPDGSGCWQCLSHRLRQNRWIDARIEAATGHVPPSPPLGSLASTRGAVYARVATALAKTIVLGRDEALDEQLLAFDAGAGCTVHRILRDPRCPVCGESSRPPTRAADVRPSGGEPSRTTGTVARRLEELVSPITGIIGEPRELAPDETAPVAVYHVLQPIPGANGARAGREIARRDGAFGRGLTPAQARLGCIAEAVERYCAAYRREDVGLRAVYRDLDAPAIAPPAILGFSERQYAMRAALNETQGAYNRVPEPFDPSASIEWTRVLSLTGGEPHLVPTACCYFAHPNATDRRFARADSNGCATGTSLDDALRRGLLELIERDAAAVWWYNRIPRPELDLDLLASTPVDGIRGWIEWRHRTLAVLDLTTDLRVPVCAAVSWEIDGGGRIVFGLGAGLDTPDAALHALTEMCQMLRLLDAPEWASSQAERPGAWRTMRNWLDTETVASQPFVVPCGKPPPPSTTFSWPERRDPLACLLKTLTDRRLSPFWLDLSRPEVGVPVVRVIVPGLRHFWARFGPGRLYDVPVALGWLDQPTPETALNPIPVFI